MKCILLSRSDPGVYAYLKKSGKLIEDADIIMASISIVEELVLVTNNVNHFERIKGLRIENWVENININQ